MLLNLLPGEEISEASSSEKSARFGHISTLQFWWARRPLAACRASLFLALCPEVVEIESNHECMNALKALPENEGISRTEDLIKNFSAVLARWESTKNENLINLARKIILIKYPNQPIVLDPFSGGGSIPLEALRLGAKVYAGDLNPVAYSSLDLALRLAPQFGSALSKKYNALSKEIAIELKSRIAEIYEGGLNDLAYIWAKSYKCPNCKCTAPLVRSRILAKGKRNIIYSFIYNKNTKPIVSINNTPTDQEVKEALKGTVSAHGAICANCNHKVDTHFLQEEAQNGRLGDLEIARYCIENGKKNYSPFHHDSVAFLDLALSQEHKLESFYDVDFDRNGIRHIWAMQYGLRSVKDTFSNRQFYALRVIQSMIQEKLKSIENYPKEFQMAMATLLCLTMNRIAMYSSRHSWWQSNGEFPASIFVRQAISMVWDYVEIPPTSTYAAGWKSASDWIEKALVGLSTIPNSAIVYCGDAASIPVKEASVDLVFTDPPYFDSVTYAYLSDYFYSLMKPILKNYYPNEFSGSSTPKKEEAIVDRLHKEAPSPKGASHFGSKMESFFIEAKRVLKDEGAMILMYGHKSPKAWAAFMTPLIESGFIPRLSIPLHTERNVKFRHSKIDALATSCLIYTDVGQTNLNNPQELTWAMFCDLLSQDYHSFQKTSSDYRLRSNDNLSAFLSEAVTKFVRYRIRYSNTRFAVLDDLFEYLRTLEESIN